MEKITNTCELPTSWLISIYLFIFQRNNEKKNYNYNQSYKYISSESIYSLNYIYNKLEMDNYWEETK